jgi:hypothetical protein
LTPVRRRLSGGALAQYLAADYPQDLQFGIDLSDRQAFSITCVIVIWIFGAIGTLFGLRFTRRGPRVRFLLAPPTRLSHGATEARLAEVAKVKKSRTGQMRIRRLRQNAGFLSVLRHPSLPQASEISGFKKGAYGPHPEIRGHPEISDGLQAGVLE